MDRGGRSGEREREKEQEDLCAFSAFDVSRGICFCLVTMIIAVHFLVHPLVGLVMLSGRSIW